MLSFVDAGRCGLSTWTDRFRRGVGGLMALAITLMVSGCGGGSNPAPKNTAAEQSSPQKAASKVERVADAHVDKSGAKRKESKIPYDAFFDEPLDIARDNSVVAGPAAATKEAAKPEEKMTTAATPAATTGGGGWDDLISMEMLTDEVKKVRNRLTAAFTNPGTYKDNYKEIAIDGAVIAALAGIVNEHSGEVTWKKNAPFARDFGKDMSQAAVGVAKDNYDKSKTAYEKLTSVLGGSLPGDAGTAEPKRPFSDVAECGSLMKRIDKAWNWLKDNINNEAKIKTESEPIQHEAAVIAALGKVITLDGYGSTDEAEYQQFAKSLIAGAQGVTAASKDQNLAAFRESLDKITKSCAQCHAKFR